MTHEEFESIAALDALGVATGDETAALRGHLGACFTCRRARDQYSEAASLIARDLAPVAPPAWMRARISAQIAPETIDARGNRWWLVAAASLLLVLLGWREREVQLGRTRETNQRAILEQLEHENSRLSSELAALGSSQTRTIALAGQEIAPAASAKVFLQPDRRRALVFFHDLPANPGDKSYQLWIIRADQPKPMSAGVFDVTKDGSASISIENLPVATEIKALAVTLEPKGGVEQPTNTAFYVAGNAGL
jgi:anti-sigma-K factor RskA